MRHRTPWQSLLFIGCMFEAGLGVIAVLLAMWLGLHPWDGMRATPGAIGLALAATLPLFGLLSVLAHARWQWARELQTLVRDRLIPCLGNAGVFSLGVLAIAAGVGEELLFRAVLQPLLTDGLGPMAGLLSASILFGLAHAITPAYFVLASLMGLYLGLIWSSTGNLLIPILIHALYDWGALLYYRKSRVS